MVTEGGTDGQIDTQCKFLNEGYTIIPGTF